MSIDPHDDEHTVEEWRQAKAKPKPKDSLEREAWHRARLRRHIPPYEKIRERRRARARAQGVDPDDLEAMRRAQPGQLRPVNPDSANQTKRKRPTVCWTIHPELVALLHKKAKEERGPLGKYRSMSSLIETACAWYYGVPLANRDLPEQPLELCPQCELGLLIDGTCRQCHWHRWRNKYHKRQLKRRPEWDLDV